MSFYKVLKLDIIRFFKELFHKILIVFALTMVIGFCINLIPGTGWLNFITKSILYSIAFIVLIYNFGFIKFEKDLFNSLLLKFKKLNL